MKRILFVHQVSVVGGASYCMLSILKGIDRDFFEPVVALRQEGPLADEIRRLNIEVLIFDGMQTVPYNKSFLHYKTIYSYAKVTRVQEKFAKLLKTSRIDVVYLNNMMLYPYLKTAKMCGCKTIIHVREHWPENEHQIQMNFARKVVKQYSDAVLAINRYSASMFPECADKTTIVYDWIDLKNRYEKVDFDKIFDESTENLKIILFTGGLARIKGTLEVIRLFSNKILGEEYRLLLMGAGLDYRFTGLSGKIKKILVRIGVKPYGFKVVEAIKKDYRVRVVPATYNIVDYVKKSYCVISYFTIPHANLGMAEAIELGTIVIAPKTDEAIEYSNNGEAALLYTLKDEEDLIRKFNYMVNNYEQVKDRVLTNSDAIQNMFSPEANIKRLNTVCKSICG